MVACAVTLDFYASSLCRPLFPAQFPTSRLARVPDRWSTTTIAGRSGSFSSTSPTLISRVRPLAPPRPPSSRLRPARAREMPPDCPPLLTARPVLPPPRAVKKGDRVAQLILERIMTPDVVEVDELDDTQRGASPAMTHQPRGCVGPALARPRLN